MKVFAALLVLFSLSVANADKCCFCEVGTDPANQMGFFKKGCQLWLNMQKNCDSKEIVPERTQYQFRDLKCDNLAIGYVGHWSSALETAIYLRDFIAPTMQKFALKNVVVDNTACSGMNNPEIVSTVVHSIPLNPGQRLEVVGNQADSIGMWEVILGPSYNFWARVESDKPGITFPSCRQFEDRPCLTNVQYGQGGRCVDRSGQLKSLKCCTVVENRGETNLSRVVWSEPQYCQ
jgi:hypothetical protein